MLSWKLAAYLKSGQTKGKAPTKSSVAVGGAFAFSYGNHVDTRVPPNPEMVAKATVPDYALGNHTASLGLTFDAGSSASWPPSAITSGCFT